MKKVLNFLLCYLAVATIAAYGQSFIDIAAVHFQPRAKEVSLSPLESVTEMNHYNVTSILSTLLETYQRITAYKNELASTRLSTEIPPPHSHCFIVERDLSEFSPASITQNLACDVPLINLLSLALQRIEDYERKCYLEDGYHLVIHHANKVIKSISLALVNITSVQNSPRMYRTCGLPSPSDFSPYQLECQVRSSQGAIEDRSRRSRLRGQATTPSAQMPPTTMVTMQTDPVPEQSSSLEANNVDPTDLIFLERSRRSVRNFNYLDATPTATTLTGCRRLDSIEGLFMYTYEVWLGLYYVQLDLSQKKKCLE